MWTKTILSTCVVEESITITTIIRTIDMARSGQVVTIVADTNHTITAFGQPLIVGGEGFSIFASAQDGATISPSGNQIVPAGTSVVFTVGVEPGFELKSILVDGFEVLIP